MILTVRSARRSRQRATRCARRRRWHSIDKLGAGLRRATHIPEYAPMQPCTHARLCTRAQKNTPHTCTDEPMHGELGLKVVVAVGRDWTNSYS